MRRFYRICGTASRSQMLIQVCLPTVGTHKVSSNSMTAGYRAALMAGALFGAHGPADQSRGPARWRYLTGWMWSVMRIAQGAVTVRSVAERAHTLLRLQTSEAHPEVLTASLLHIRRSSRRDIDASCLCRGTSRSAGATVHGVVVTGQDLDGKSLPTIVW